MDSDQKLAKCRDIITWMRIIAIVCVTSYALFVNNELCATNSTLIIIYLIIETAGLYVMHRVKKSHVPPASDQKMLQCVPVICLTYIAAYVLCLYELITNGCQSKFLVLNCYIIIRLTIEAILLCTILIFVQCMIKHNHQIAVAPPAPPVIQVSSRPTELGVTIRPAWS